MSFHTSPLSSLTSSSLQLRFRGLQNGVFAPPAVWRKWLLCLALLLALWCGEHALA